jgi:hypothetical protein
MLPDVLESCFSVAVLFPHRRVLSVRALLSVVVPKKGVGIGKSQIYTRDAEVTSRDLETGFGDEKAQLGIPAFPLGLSIRKMSTAPTVLLTKEKHFYGSR